MAYNPDNSRKLKKVCQDRGFTQDYIDERIARYIKVQYSDRSAAAKAFDQMKKEFARKLMSDVFLIRAFIVLGLSNEEILKARKGG